MRLLRTGELLATTFEAAELEKDLEQRSSSSSGTATLGALVALAALPFSGSWMAPVAWGALIGFHWGVAHFWDQADRIEGRRPRRSLCPLEPANAWAIVLAAMVVDPLRGLAFGGALISALHGLLAVHFQWLLADLAVAFTTSSSRVPSARNVLSPRPKPAAFVPVPRGTVAVQLGIARMDVAEGAACRVCGDGLEQEELLACASCETPHHRACWYYNRGCAVYGCESREGVALERREAREARGPSPVEVSMIASRPCQS